MTGHLSKTPPDTCPPHNRTDTPLSIEGVLSSVRHRTEDRRGSTRTAQPSTPSGPPPRLLNLHQAAAYLGVSFWSVRDYVLAGLVPSVQLPALRPREGDKPRQTLRRVLVDVEDLNAFIAQHKATNAADVQSRAPGESGTNLRAMGPVCARTQGAPKGDQCR